jgi:Ca2+-binding EF-hand superfamily protein
MSKEDMEEGGEATLEMMAGFLITEFDKDNDGKLSKDEFIEAFSDISEKKN